MSHIHHVDQPTLASADFFYDKYLASFELVRMVNHAVFL